MPYKPCLVLCYFYDSINLFFRGDSLQCLGSILVTRLQITTSSCCWCCCCYPLYINVKPVNKETAVNNSQRHADACLHVKLSLELLGKAEIVVFQNKIQPITCHLMHLNPMCLCRTKLLQTTCTIKALTAFLQNFTEY